MPNHPEMKATSESVAGLSPGSLAYGSGGTLHPAGAEPHWLGLPRSTWMQIAIVTGLFAAVFWPNLVRLWKKTNPISGEPNWGHAIVVPLIGLYFLYLNREKLLGARVSPLLPWPMTRGRVLGAVACAVMAAAVYLVGPAMLPQWSGHLASLGYLMFLLAGLGLVLNWGLAFLLTGLALYGYGIYPGQNDFVKDFGMVVTLFGLVALLCGWSVMKVAWFPILFLIAALPWPPLVYSWVAGPLQLLAAQVGVVVLKLTGVAAMQDGTKIYMPNSPPLNVEEACAGLKSLMTFISVGAAVAFLSSRPLWQKLFITASAVPIAIFCNVMRVSGQGLLNYYISPQLADGFAHTFVGMIMLVPAFFMLLGVAWVMDNLFIEEADESDEAEIAEIRRRRSATASPVAPMEGQ